MANFNLFEFEKKHATSLSLIKGQGLELWPVIRIFLFFENTYKKSSQGRRWFFFKYLLQNLAPTLLFFQGKKKTLFFCESVHNGLADSQGRRTNKLLAPFF